MAEAKEKAGPTIVTPQHPQAVPRALSSSAGAGLMPAPKGPARKESFSIASPRSPPPGSQQATPQRPKIDVKDLESELQMYKDLKASMEIQRVEEIARISAERDELSMKLESALNEIASLQERAVSRRSLDVPRGAAPVGASLIRVQRPMAMGSLPRPKNRSDGAVNAGYVATLEARVLELERVLRAKDDSESEPGQMTAVRLEDTTRLAQEYERKLQGLQEELERDRAAHELETVKMRQAVDVLRTKLEHRRAHDRKHATAEREKIEQLERGLRAANERLTGLGAQPVSVSVSPGPAQAPGGASSEDAAGAPLSSPRTESESPAVPPEASAAAEERVQTLRERQVSIDEHELRIRALNAQIVKAEAEQPAKEARANRSFDTMREEELREQAKMMATIIATSETTEAMLKQQIEVLKREIEDLRRSQWQGGLNLPYLRNAVFKYITSDDKKSILPAVAEMFGFSPEEKAKAMSSLSNFKLPFKR
eukprot:m51a1_g4161 GRIP domain containing protein B (484) ;mRNA; r:279698-281557